MDGARSPVLFPLLAIVTHMREEPRSRASCLLRKGRVEPSSRANEGSNHREALRHPVGRGGDSRLVGIVPPYKSPLRYNATRD